MFLKAESDSTAWNVHDFSQQKFQITVRLAKNVKICRAKNCQNRKTNHRQIKKDLKVKVTK